MKNLKITLAAIFMIAVSSVQAQISPTINLSNPYRVLNGPFENTYTNLNGLTTQFVRYIYGQDITVFSSEDGNKLECYMRDGYPEEFWIITNVGGGFYTIRNNHVNLSIDNLGSTAEGAGIVNKVPSNSDSQKWQFVSIGDNFYKIINKVSGKALTRSYESISQKNYTGTFEQKWRLSDYTDGNLGFPAPEPKVIISSISPNPVTGDYMTVKVNMDRSDFQQYKIFDM
jgi:Ricin-type beta-trefoil lectin domain-like